MLFLFQGCIGLNFEEWQDLQDGLFKTKQGANYGQDYRIYRTKGWGLTGG